MVRKWAVAMMLVVAMTSCTWAVGMLGAPKATMEPGKMAVGGSWSTTDQAITLTGNGIQLAVHDIESADWLGNLYFGLHENATVSFSFGGSTVDRDNVWEDTSDGLILGGGVNLTLWQKGELSIGAVGRIEVQESDSEKLIPIWCRYMLASLDASWMETVVGLGMNLDLGGLSLYGGPMYYSLDGSMDVKYFGPFVQRYDLNAADTGVFAGGSLEVLKNVKLMAEWMATSDMNSLGAGALIEF